MIVETIEQWLATRPENLQVCAAKYPPGCRIQINGVIHWVIGYNEYADETVGLKVTPADAKIDYDLARELEIDICPEHLL